MIKRAIFTFLAALLLTACSGEFPTEARYAPVDALFSKVLSKVDGRPGSELLMEIDHSRLGAKEGSAMPPARVALISNPELETRIVETAPLAALELPLRVLAYEDPETGDARVTANRYTYVAARHDLSAESQLGSAYTELLDAMLSDLPDEAIADFAVDDPEDTGIITVESAYGFDETLRRIDEAIDGEDDALLFGQVDFRAQAAELGVDLAPITLILFGGPGPGAKAMSEAPTLGLDAFCQKFLVWQDDEGRVFLSYNDLVAMAHRQDVPVAVPLRVIKFRLKQVFETAITE